ncbi:hypothetical protein DFH06DRAFT_1477707 [Mycena polygramma]|nr:hypothetical protein DFH06DRAFT_1477707 [Mycena polygramma]
MAQIWTDIEEDDRQEKILRLVEMLLQRPGSVDSNPHQLPGFEEDRDMATPDEHWETAGAATFHKFHRRIQNFDTQLRNFSNATRQLGASVGILSSAFHLRERIAQILFLYGKIAADLFPRKISHLPRAGVVAHTPTHVFQPVIFDESLDLEDFPDQFEALANSIVTLGRSLDEFSEFTDETINASIILFEGDLRYWASCLQVYRGQFRYPAVQRYVHDLTTEMGEHIDSISSTLVLFSEVFPLSDLDKIIKWTACKRLHPDISWSTVTATTLQFSISLTGSALRDSVNCFWFASLVFSIAAAVNSLLGLTWKQAIYRPPGYRVPWWVLIWIKRSPLVFLVLSIVSFSVGLCLFTYASGQHIVTSTITTIFTIFTSSGLAAVATWFASERYVFLRHRGRKWLMDVLLDFEENLSLLPGVNRPRRAFRGIKRRLRAAQKAAAHFFSKIVSCTPTPDSDDLEANVLPVSSHKTPVIAVAVSTAEAGVEPTSPPSQELTAPSVFADEIGTPAPGRVLWKKAMQAVKMRTGERKGGPAEDPLNAIMVRWRTTSSRPRLLKLEATKRLEGHETPVRHMQFSSDGKLLVTSSWDHIRIWRIEKAVGLPYAVHVAKLGLGLTQGLVGHVAWSDTGNTLLTKRIRGVKVWTEDGICQQTIDRQTDVESIIWFPGSQAFLSVEGNTVTKLDLRGNVLDQYDFGRIKLHAIAVTADGIRLLGVGPLLRSPTGLYPAKAPAETRLVVYNMDLHRFEHQAPVLNDVRDVTLARYTRHALVSYENKAPPQLWRVRLVEDQDNPALFVSRLELIHAYLPKHPVRFAGPSYFGGTNDELVLCAGKGAFTFFECSDLTDNATPRFSAGDIHIWDRETGALLRYIRAAEESRDLTCVAWNHAVKNPFMFATGSHDGGVRIWTEPKEQPPDVGGGLDGEGDTDDIQLVSEREEKERTDGASDPIETQRRQRPLPDATLTMAQYDLSSANAQQREDDEVRVDGTARIELDEGEEGATAVRSPSPFQLDVEGTDAAETPTQSDLAVAKAVSVAANS